nr:hypothetical protein CFP56_38032 [Quercus suber]
MRGSGRGGEVGNTRKLSHPLRKFRVRRVRIVQRVYAKKSKSFHLQLNQASEQDFISSAPTHVVFVFLIQSLIGLIQVEYQSKSLSPFDTHPISANHHVATVSTSGAISNTLPRAPGVSAAAGVPSSSISSSDSASCSFVDTMLDPFVPTVVEASCLADIDEFVTPINIPDPASLDFDNVSSPSTIVQPIPNVLPSYATFSSPIQVLNSDQVSHSSTPVVSVSPVPLRKSTRDIRPPAYL